MQMGNETHDFDMGDHLLWIFEIHFDRMYPTDVAVFGADYFDMPVLMDGRVIPLRRCTMSAVRVRSPRRPLRALNLAAV